ncbi:hypothetical protein AB0E04_17715 [Streptomyces sp. NPDC048251]|uniref:hypothetical protein n=1 Tax=Streptomyces sp. NPDC048251 TaxID=3154501 RepID=UPI00342028A7
MRAADGTLVMLAVKSWTQEGVLSCGQRGDENGEVLHRIVVDVQAIDHENEKEKEIGSCPPVPAAQSPSS